MVQTPLRFRSDLNFAIDAAFRRAGVRDLQRHYGAPGGGFASGPGGRLPDVVALVMGDAASYLS